MEATPTKQSIMIWDIMVYWLGMSIVHLLLFVGLVVASAPYWDANGPQASTMFGVLLLDVLAIGGINGFIIAYFQRKLLGRMKEAGGQWVVHCVVGLAFGWLLFLAGHYLTSTSGRFSSSSFLGFYEPSALLSVACGISIASAQWLSIKHYYSRAESWPWIMGLAWGTNLYIFVPLFVWPQEQFGLSPAVGLLPGLILATIAPSMLHVACMMAYLHLHSKRL